MIDPFNSQRKYMIWTFTLIIFLIVSGIAVAGEKSEWLNKNSDNINFNIGKELYDIINS